MAYSSDTYYTWIAQGEGGIQACPVTTSVVKYDLSPFNEETVNLLSSVQTIHEWPDYNTFNNDTTTRITLNWSGGNVSKVVLQCNGGGQGTLVEVYDNDNHRVPSKEYYFSPSLFDYNKWCPTMPVYLVLLAVPGDPPAGGIHLSYVGKVSPLKQVNYSGWWSDLLSLYANTGGDRELQLMDELLDGKYLDSEGVAPTGGTGGGGGYYSRPDEIVSIPSLPAVSVCDTGFVSLFKVTTGELQALATYMWDNNFFNSIVKNFNSPMENIISLNLIPFNPSGDPGNIVIGNVDTGIASSKLSTSFFHVSCGQKNVSEYYRTFADYAPFTPSIGLFLPFVGIVNLNPDDCMNGYIKVDYNIDVFSGACVAFVSCNTNGVWHVLQQHQGTITSSFPLSGQNYMNVYTGILNAASSFASGAFVNSANQMANIKPEYQRSGNVSSTAGILGTQYPYLIFTTPQYIMAENFRDVKGYTSNLKVRVGDQSGYLQATADNSELSNIPCTEEERSYIRQMLADGIYV